MLLLSPRPDAIGLVVPVVRSTRYNVANWMRYPYGSQLRGGGVGVDEQLAIVSVTVLVTVAVSVTVAVPVMVAVFVTVAVTVAVPVMVAVTVFVVGVAGGVHRQVAVVEWPLHESHQVEVNFVDVEHG